MPRKKTTPAAKPDAILPDELLEKLIPGPRGRDLPPVAVPAITGRARG